MSAATFTDHLDAAVAAHRDATGAYADDDARGLAFAQLDFNAAVLAALRSLAETLELGEVEIDMGDEGPES